MTRRSVSDRYVKSPVLREKLTTAFMASADGSRVCSVNGSRSRMARDFLSRISSSTSGTVQKFCTITT